MTKDEFLDVMGEIDERIIDGALDVSRMETVIVPYKRPPVLRYILSAAACAAVVLAVAGAVRFLNGRALLPNDEISDSSVSESSDSPSETESADDGFNPDFIRGWNPEDIPLDGEPALGGSMVASTAELDGITAYLIMRDITKLPGEPYAENGHDYTGYYGARDIMLYFKDDHGRKALMDGITWHGGEIRYLPRECIFDGATRLYKITEDGEEEYELMQYVDYDKDKDALIARYYHVDMSGYDGGAERDENRISDCEFRAHDIFGAKRIGGSSRGYQASKSFVQKDNNIFADPEYGYELTLHIKTQGQAVYPDELPEGYENAQKFTGFDPRKLEYEPYPERGETAAVARDELDGVSASLIMYNVIKRPGESHPIYSSDGLADSWVAEEIYIYIDDGKGRSTMGWLPTPPGSGYDRFMRGVCLFDGCLRLFKTEYKGEDRYVLMLFFDVDAENGEPVAFFFDVSMELYTFDEPKDENGTKIGGLWYIHPAGVAGSIGTRVSPSFRHKEGATFVDPEYGYELTIDFDAHFASAVPAETSETTG